MKPKALLSLLWIFSASIAQSITFKFEEKTIQGPNSKVTVDGITMSVTTISTPDLPLHVYSGQKSNGGVAGYSWILGLNDAKASAKGNSDSLLTNFVAAQLTFSGAKAVNVDSFVIRDIDHLPGSNDTVWVVGSCGSEAVPVIYEPGSSLKMIKWAGGSAYCAANAYSCHPSDPKGHLSVKFEKPVDAITIFLNNSFQQNPRGQQAIDLNEIKVTAVSSTP
jgi:hypothetical protein